MQDGSLERPLIRFGVFELDSDAGELRKSGVLIHLSPQPVTVLALLVGRPGHLVRREEIRQQVWGEGTYVDFEQGLNHCIKQIRTALGDDADVPRYIQTLPRRGYRFIAPVESAVAAASAEAEKADPIAVATEGAPARRPAVLTWAAAVLILAGIGVGVLLIFNAAGLRGRLLPKSASPRIESIAVLPLENLSRDPDQEYFADGMTEELITTLGRVGALRVISRTSVMRYKGTKKPLPEIARELNVDAVIEGTVSRSGNRVRITANLLQATADRHLWAQAYERDLGDVLTLQREVARSVVREIRAAFPPQEQKRLAASRPINPEAHELYLKGQYHYYKWQKEEFEKAVAYFEKAIAVDPDYAQAYLGLAKTYGWLWMEGYLQPREAYPRFNTALKKALAIDDTLPEAHYVLAVSAWYFYWDWAHAEAEFQRALALNPNLEESRFEYGWFLATMGRFPEAIAEARRAVEGDPLSVSANLALGSIYHFARQYDQAIAQYLKAAELEPNDPRAYDLLAASYEVLGLYQEAVRERQKQMTLSGASPESVAALGEAYRVSGYTGYLRWRLERAANPYHAAIIQAQLGLKDEALANLEKAYREHWWAMVQLKTLPKWDTLRSDPRFQDLLRRMKFPS